MEVSVVIPVYNAEKYVSMAIDSALVQEEVKEVILVEDGSPDNALQICEDYASRNTRVVLVRHPNGENRGAGASFNLGIKHARYQYIAFLGADDQFVPNRFKSARHIFSTCPDAHGVYAHIGAIYYDEVSKEKHLKRIPQEISGMHDHVHPAELLKQLLRGNNGHISLDSLVVRRDILTDAFLFDESLRLGQDTDLMYRLAGVYRLYAPEDVEVVALRGVHEGNRVFRFEEAAMYRQRVLKKCIKHRYYGCKDYDTAVIVIKRYLEKAKWSLVIRYIPVLPLSLKRKLIFLAFCVANPSAGLYLIQLGRRKS